MNTLSRSRNHRSILIAGLLFLLTLAACLPPQGGTPEFIPEPNAWAEALRALDPADAPTPAYDITAVYLRPDGANLQIRIDLLAFQASGQVSLDIRIGDASTPEAVPLDIRIPSESDSARIALDPLLATAIVTIPLAGIPAHPRVDVSTPEDEITGLTLDSPVPAQTTPLLLTFNDTFAARFPAEALRSWDGAHTGPRGERHGLKHLLDAVEEYQNPIVLLDLKEPETLSALDAMEVLPRIQKLSDDGLLILPENGLKAARTPPGSATQFFGMDFGLPTSPFSYQSKSTHFQFAFLEDNSHLYHPLFSKTTYLPIATQTDTTQPTPNGPSLEVRRALLETALNADGKDLLVLGGRLRDTTWGSSDMVGPTLAYFASRPYIQILTADELMNFPTQSGKPELRSMVPDEALDELTVHYQNLTQPVLDFVTNWKGSPLSSCATDLDKDNQPECVLANDDYLAIFDPQGARLTYFFSVGRNSDVGRIDNPPYSQLIGPSWQVAVGLSDPSTWDLSAGEAADPGAYPGAFADVDYPFKSYDPTIEGNALIFTSLDGARTKIFKLSTEGIEVEYQTQEPARTQILLLVDPDTRFTPGWGEQYVQDNAPGGVAWGLENGPMIQIQSSGSVTMRAFNESLSLLETPEDPDFEYPPGHYIPFPMAVVEITIEDTTAIIQINYSP